MTREKCPTGVDGLDQILRGGLPRGRTTLVSGGPGCGKTVLGMEFLSHGAQGLDEPGLFVSFEEPSDQLASDFEQLAHSPNGDVEILSMLIGGEGFVSTGEFNLDGLFIRLDHALEETGAQRLVLDGLDALFGAFDDTEVVRRELVRLFAWLRERGLTTLTTAGFGQSGFREYGVEAYISDCVIVLDHRTESSISKRRLRVVKYRGSRHGSDEYPFLITGEGISVLPITALGLDYSVSNERISSGLDGLDAMLDDEGYYRGSTVLISGTAGTGKSTLAAAFAERACAHGLRALHFSFEEPSDQIVRNMRSVGIDLAAPREAGRLEMRARRPSYFGIEEHLISIQRTLDAFEPEVVVLDPITSFIQIGEHADIRSLLTRLIDMFKTRGITTVMTSLLPTEGTDRGAARVSSLMDTWLKLEFDRHGERRRRHLHIIKSRGMPHSDTVVELVLDDDRPRIRMPEASDPEPP